MSRWHWQSGSRRRATSLTDVLAVVLAVALPAIGQLPTVARAGPLLPMGHLSKLDLAWVASLAPVPSEPRAAAEPPPLLTFDDAPSRRYSLAEPSPGLQFSLDPDDEEIFLGWQIEF